MKKVFHFDAPRENYHCEAAVVSCFDNRFHLVFEKFLKRIGINASDPIKLAGGAKNLASPGKDTDREFVIEQIRTSVRLHGTARAILMVHSDCGAYGGLSKFGNDAKLEASHHERELARAAQCVRQYVPGVAVQGYFVDFEGVWEADVSAPAAETAAGH